MAIVLEVYTTEEQHFVVCSLWTKGLRPQDIHKKKNFLFTVGSVCYVKQFTQLVEKFSRGCSKVVDEARLGVEVVETTVKRL
jgi:hypothetical protein